MKHFAADGLPADYVELCEQDYVFKFFRLLGSSPDSRVDATFLLEVDAIVDLPEAERAKAIRESLMGIAGEGRGGGDEQLEL